MTSPPSPLIAAVRFSHWTVSNGVATSVGQNVASTAIPNEGFLGVFAGPVVARCGSAVRTEDWTVSGSLGSIVDLGSSGNGWLYFLAKISAHQYREKADCA